MRHFAIEAEWSVEDGAWIASWASPLGILVTEGKTKEALEVNIRDAIETLLTGEADRHFTFDVVYR